MILSRTIINNTHQHKIGMVSQRTYFLLPTTMHSSKTVWNENWKKEEICVTDGRSCLWTVPYLPSLTLYHWNYDFCDMLKILTIWKVQKLFIYKYVSAKGTIIYELVEKEFLPASNNEITCSNSINLSIPKVSRHSRLNFTF